jgi:2-iminobutanoate/2-iminopropanoate deaminase
LINRIANERIYEATRRVFEEARRDAREMAIAVTDEAGGLVFAACTDRCPSRVLTHAVRKAHTAAVMQRDTVVFREQDQQANKTLADWGSDPMLTHLVGGSVLARGAEFFGGVGVGGNTTERDEQVSRLARDVLLGGVEAVEANLLGPSDVAEFGPSITYAQRAELFALTGVQGVDPVTGRLAEGAEAQFDLAFSNVELLGERCGFSTSEIGRITVFTPDPRLRPAINPGWLRLFPDEQARPARRTTHVPLDPGTWVELEIVGARGPRTTIEIDGVRHHDPLPMGARVGRHVFSSAIGSDIPFGNGERPSQTEAVRQAFRNLASFVQSAGATLDDVANVWVYLGLWDLHPDYVDVWLEIFEEDTSRPSRKTFYYPRVDIQLQCEAVVGGRRRNLEIPGIGHHDPIPMGSVTGGVFTSSGIDGRDPETGRTPRGVSAQSKAVLANLERLLDEAELSRAGLLHVTGLLGERRYKAVFDQAWRSMFSGSGPAPAVQVMELGLPARDTLVQVVARGVVG